MEYVREDGAVVVKNANEDEDGSEKDDDDDAEVVDDGDTGVAVTRSVEGMAGNSCILLRSGLPPLRPGQKFPMSSVQSCRWM